MHLVVVGGSAVAKLAVRAVTYVRGEAFRSRPGFVFGDCEAETKHSASTTPATVNTTGNKKQPTKLMSRREFIKGGFRRIHEE